MKKFKKMTREDFQTIQEDQRSILLGYHDNIIDRSIQRRDVVDNYDMSFFNLVSQMFEYNQDVNSLFIDDFKDNSDIDLISSFGVEYDKLNTCVRLQNNVGLATLYSRKIYTNEPDRNSKMNNFYLIADDEVAHDCSIQYFIETDTNETYPMVPNSKTPFVIIDNSKAPLYVRIKAVIKRHKYSSNVPFIKGISLMYEDEYTKSQLDIFDPKFELENNDPDDLIVLFRDNTNDDLLYKVESSKDKTMLYYDDNNQLMQIDIFDIKNGSHQSRVELIYEDYINSQGLTERVLGKVKTINSTKKLKEEAKSK